MLDVHPAQGKDLARVASKPPAIGDNSLRNSLEILDLACSEVVQDVTETIYVLLLLVSVETSIGAELKKNLVV